MHGRAMAAGYTSALKGGYGAVVRQVRFAPRPHFGYAPHSTLNPFTLATALLVARPPADPSRVALWPFRLPRLLRSDFQRRLALHACRM